MFKNKLNMNLQYFAEPGEGKGGGEPKPPESIPDEYNGLVDGIVQKSNSKYLKQIDTLNGSITDLKGQIEELKTNGMTGEQKNSYQMQKLQDQLNESKKANQSLQAQITKGQLTTKVMEMSKNDGLSIDKDQLGLIVSEDKDSTMQKYDAFKKFAKSQEDAMKKKFGSVPNSSTHSGNNQKDTISESAKRLSNSINGNKYTLKDIK